jgi:hypothetical protein
MTDEDATALFNQMTELIKSAEKEGGQPSSITTGISETLEMLLKGYGPVPDAMDGFSASSMGGESRSSRDLDAAPTLGDHAEAKDERDKQKGLHGKVWSLLLYHKFMHKTSRPDPRYSGWPRRPTCRVSETLNRAWS